MLKVWGSFDDSGGNGIALPKIFVVLHAGRIVFETAADSIDGFAFIGPQAAIRGHTPQAFDHARHAARQQSVHTFADEGFLMFAMALEDLQAADAPTH
ncbi:MAG: hypothetical protein RIK87_07610 [Fuerstiella sp.]